MTDPATTSVPAAGPVCVGVNDTEMIQVPAAASVLHVFPAKENSDGWTIVGVNEVAGPRLVTVTEEGVKLVCPTSTLPKSSTRGWTVTSTGAGPPTGVPQGFNGSVSEQVVHVMLLYRELSRRSV